MSEEDDRKEEVKNGDHIVSLRSPSGRAYDQEQDIGSGKVAFGSMLDLNSHITTR